MAKTKKKSAPKKAAGKKPAPAKKQAAKKPAKKASRPAAKKAPKKKTPIPSPRALQAALHPERRAAFKNEVLKKLLEARRLLLAEVGEKVKHETDNLRFEIGDIYDIASIERERELTLMLGDREREKLQDIDRALERLREKDYGICEDCGEAIGENRLKAMPFTRVCVDCKTKAEKESRFKGRPEEEAPLGIIERPEGEEEEGF